MPIELVFVIGIAVLLFLCLKVKANAFMALLATALVMGCSPVWEDRQR